jgi:tellurite methyltransferase
VIEASMHNADAIKWNQRYAQTVEAAFEQPRSFLIESAGLLPQAGLALDVAMGLGGNAGYLIERGLRVIGLDVSEVAVQYAKRRWPQLMATVIDLLRFDLPVLSFDVVINFYYLQRDLWPLYRRVIRPGGVLIMETLLQDGSRSDVHPDYFLAPDELRYAFANWNILTYRESNRGRDPDSARAVASLAARKP